MDSLWCRQQGYLTVVCIKELLGLAGEPNEPMLPRAYDDLLGPLFKEVLGLCQ